MSEMCCPKCGSKELYIDKKGFSVGKAVAGGVLTGNVLVGAAAGSIGKNKIQCTCLKCGKKFKIEEADRVPSVSFDERIKAVPEEEMEEYRKYLCDCGKKSSLPVSHPYCPKCGRRLSEKNYAPAEKHRAGCLPALIIPPIVVFVAFLLLF